MFRRLMMAQRGAGSGIPTNQIWYESYSGESVTPYNTSAFGIARIVSNTFEGESGVILFDADVPQVGSSAFFNCSNLSTVTLPDTVVGTLGNYAFCQCYSLSRINLPKGITSIGPFAFYRCESLLSIELPPHLREIGENAFRGSILREVEIPQSVKSIGKQAFDNSSWLRSVKMKSPIPPTISSDSFPYGCRFQIPAGSLTTYQTAWPSLKNYFDEY